MKSDTCSEDCIDFLDLVYLEEQNKLSYNNGIEDKKMKQILDRGNIIFDRRDINLMQLNISKIKEEIKLENFEVDTDVSILRNKWKRH